MTKLIGTNPNQVPSNADLGSAAFLDQKDFLLSRGSSLSEIDAVIVDAAVQVLVYDTTLDSDGGEWRKRTEHTSWYNEKLNTVTRGSRREFPQVAIIVVSAGQISIHDADDPTLPMWMIFEGTSYITWATASSTLSRHRCAMVNGILGQVTNDGGTLMNFVLDEVTLMYNSETYGLTSDNHSGNKIEDRNRPSDFTSSVGRSIKLCYWSMNDIAMIVRPNAKVDVRTGLPIPTIAVATDQGVSVIVDIIGNSSYTALVYDIEASDNADSIETIDFLGPDKITFYNSNHYSQSVFDIPTKDITVGGSIHSGSEYRYSGHAAITSGVRAIETSNGGGSVGESANDGHTLMCGGNVGLSQFYRNPSKPTNAMVAHTTRKYATGWMHGDIKCATMCEIEPEITGRNLISNSTFSGQTTGWTNYLATISSVNNKLRVDRVTNTHNHGNWAQHKLDCDIGRTYYVTMGIHGITNCSSLIRIGLGLNAPWSWIFSQSPPGGTYTFSFVATQTTHYLLLGQSSPSANTNSTIDYDDVYVYEGVRDRSNTGSDLQQFGLLQTVPVASGADLRAYTGFTPGNYNGRRLERPYNADLNVGTGDYTIAFWCNDIGTGSDLMGLGKRGVDLSWNLYHDAGGGLRMHVSSNGTGYTSIFETQFNGYIDRWTHVVITKIGAFYSMYVDGRERVSAIYADTLYNTSKPFMIGAGTTNNTINSDAKFALLRISKTGATAAQIEKMYRDEKALFEKDAKASIYGTSNAISEMAYDDSTETLHIGTSSGRSSFQGLRRVDNTVDAITTSISAVSGYIAEE